MFYYAKHKRLCEFVFERVEMNEFAIDEYEAPLQEAKDAERQDEQPDLLPEFCRYRDDGCELAESCLNCPFPECIYDHPRGKISKLKAIRDDKIIKIYREGNHSLSEVAAEFNVSIRTVQRALAGRRKKNERK